MKPTTKPTPHRTRRMRRAAFLIFPLIVLPLLLVAAAPPGATQQTSPAVAAQNAPDTSGTLKLIVTVMDEKWRFVSGLRKDAFAVFEGKTEREITYFDQHDVPVSVGVLLDSSGSMEIAGLQAAKLTAARFMQQGHPDNDYFIGDFNQEWRELTGWTRDEKVMIEGLSKAGVRPAEAAKRQPRPSGQTALHDACLAALEKLATATHPKRALLVITDGGEDNASTHKLRELKQLIKTSDVLVYAIALPVEGERYFDQIGLRNLEEIAEISGGWAFFPERKQVIEAVDRLALGLRHQYVVGFTPANAAQSGEWNKVKIKVKPPPKFPKSLYVRSREGYFSPPAPAP